MVYLSHHSKGTLNAEIYITDTKKGPKLSCGKFWTEQIRFEIKFTCIFFIYFFYFTCECGSEELQINLA